MILGEDLSWWWLHLTTFFKNLWGGDSAWQMILKIQSQNIKSHSLGTTDILWMTSWEKRILTKIVIVEQVILMPLYQSNLKILFWNVFFLKVLWFCQIISHVSNTVISLPFAIFRVKFYSGMWFLIVLFSYSIQLLPYLSRWELHLQKTKTNLEHCVFY